MGEPAETAVARLRALGVNSVVLNPSANRPPAGDLLNVMTESAGSLQRIFGEASGDP